MFPFDHQAACRTTRRGFLEQAAGMALLAGSRTCRGQAGAQDMESRRAKIAITMDLEMSRDYPVRGMREWDFQKGNLDAATKEYALRAAKLVRDRGGVIHFFCVGRVLEQADVRWLDAIVQMGHPVGNHTYDHVNVLARTVAEAQFRFRRSPWLAKGRNAADLIRDNIVLTTEAMEQRLGIRPNGFRTPGGFSEGLAGRPDVQQMLLDLGFPWVSAKYPRHAMGEPQKAPDETVWQDVLRAQSDAQPFHYPSGLAEVPMSPISDVTAFRSHGWQRKWFMEGIRRGVQWAIEQRACFDFLCHPSCMVVEDPQCESIRLICDLVEQANDRAEIVGLDRFAEPLRAVR